MKHIKPYKLFESSQHISKEDIYDILLELTDSGKVDIKHSEPYYNEESFPLASNYITIKFNSELDWKSEIYDTIIRLISYLGDNFIDFYCEPGSKDEIYISDISDIDLHSFDRIKEIIFRYKFDDDIMKISIGHFSITDQNSDIIKMNDDEVKLISDILSSYKSHKTGLPVLVDIGRDSVGRVAKLNIFNSGYTWLLKEKYDYVSVSLHKLSSGHFLVNFRIDFKSIHSFITSDIESLIKLIKIKL